jgi:CRISPR/Cas system CSM-associated protein Csm2 small subunit
MVMNDSEATTPPQQDPGAPSEGAAQASEGAVPAEVGAASAAAAGGAPHAPDAPDAPDAAGAAAGESPAGDAAVDRKGKPPERGERGRGEKRRRGKGGGGQERGERPDRQDRQERPERQARYVEDRIDVDAEVLARETKAIPPARIRPLAEMTGQIRRLLATGDAQQRREARRALVLFKSRVAFLAGRETGRERNAFVRVRDLFARGIDSLVRDREQVDVQQTRNFLDLVDAYVGYHRFHGDDRRRD